MKKLLCPSMMCANFGDLSREVRELENAGADIFHLDVMDGSFVPNFGMGLQDIAYICRNATIPCDVHLMIRNPDRYVELFAGLGAKIIYIHPEADAQAAQTLRQIRSLGCRAGIAVNPETSFGSVQDLLPLCDCVLVMSVHPGFAGQKYLDFVTEKFREFVSHSEAFGGYEVLIDGACSPEKVRQLSAMGVTGFILGTSALFGKDKPYSEILPELRAS